MNVKTSVIESLKRVPLFRALVRWSRNSILVRAYRRRKFALSYYRPQLKYIRGWIWKRTENSNFYYDISELNKVHLAQILSHILKTSYEQILGYFHELESDEDLKKHIELGLKKYGQDFIRIEFGRRLGWYAVVRAIKPNLVVETGVHQGVGACVLTSALLRNFAEGSSGTYIGTDISKNAGNLLSGKYKSMGEIMFGDSIESLNKLTDKIDVFINDSDHSAEYEAAEYETVTRLLSDNCVLIGDNSHVTTKLSDYSRKHGRDFLFFSEKPKNHWYPGAGIGFSFKTDAEK
jgi:hypothetical protein